MASSSNRIKHTVCFKPQIFLTHIADYLKKGVDCVLASNSLQLHKSSEGAGGKNSQDISQRNRQQFQPDLRNLISCKAMIDIRLDARLDSHIW